MSFIPIAKPYVGEEEAHAVFSQVMSGWISMGEKVREFESLLQEYTGAKHAVAFSNGTATLHTGLLALGVKPGDEVIVPSLSYISSANAVLFCNAEPVFAEENPKTFNVDVEALEKKITPRTKVIMPVDLKGMPVDYEPIMELAGKYGVGVLADSAESFGAIYKGKKVGSQAGMHSFSMFANKSITAGEGGFITTDDDDIAEFCRCFRNQGQKERYVHVMIGHNYRMTDIAAAFAIEQAKRVEWIMNEKSSIAAFYNDAFRDHPLLITPYVPDYVTRHSWYMYTLVTDPKVDRDLMASKMKQKGVDHRLSFPLIPLQPVYRELYGYKEGDFAVAEEIYNTFIDIPCWVGMKREELEYVVSVVIDAAENAVK